MRVQEVPAVSIPIWENTIRELLNDITDLQPEVTWGDILNDLREEKLHVWVFYDSDRVYGVATAEAVYRNKELELHVVHAAGEPFESWADLLRESMIKAAKRIGAKHIRATGRPGWKKWADRLGMVQHAVIWEVRGWKQSQ